MALDPVPYFIEGGALHSAEVMRLLPFVLSGGGEGVAASTHMKVTALDVPGSGVRIAAGACLILNRSPGGTDQTYVGRAGTSTQVTISATGSGAGRSDLVVVRVEDPQYSPWQAPADRKVGPYFKPFVISGVPAGTISAAQLNLGYSAIALARIDLPASTGAVVSSHITDLRQLARARKERYMLVSAAPPGTEQLNATSYARWITPATWPVFIPSWATYCTARVDVINSIHTVGNVVGAVGLFADGAGPVVSMPYAEDWSGASTRVSQLAAGQFPIGPAIRGASRTFDLRALKNSTSPGFLSADAQTRVILDIEFTESVA